MARTLGLDYGEKRIGVAVSDSMGIVATPRGTIQVQNRRQVLSELGTLCSETGAEKIVVGMPYHLSGRKGALADAVDKFVRDLKAKVSLEVVTWDERFSSKSAEDVLIQAGTRREKRKHVIDKLAAQIMLQNYLDAHQ